MKVLQQVQHRTFVWFALFVFAALLASIGGAKVYAAISGSGNVPESMTYQGVLSDSSGPFSGNAQIVFSLYEQETGGSSIWQETHSNVTVTNGFFSAVLGGQGQPLAASLFGGSERWLQVSADLGSGPVTLPRQRLHSVPYAMTAYSATNAEHATTADTVLNPPPYAGSPFQNVLTVAKSGGDYTSVASALASITTASTTNPYLVWVAPGVYNETSLVNVPGYVHLRGAGRDTTSIVASRQATFNANADAAVVQLNNYSKLSDLSIVNDSISQNATGILVAAGATTNTEIDNVEVEVARTGGTVHTAIHIQEAAATIRESSFLAAGGNAFNNALTSYVADMNGPYQMSTIERSVFRGEGDVGYGMQLFSSQPVITESKIFGGLRALYSTGNGGSTMIKSSELEIPLIGANLPDSVLLELPTFAEVDIFHSNLIYSVADPATRRAGTGALHCMDNYLRLPFLPWVMYNLRDGTNSATACEVVP